MIVLYKTKLKNFDYDYFTAAFAVKYGLDCLKFSKKSGIISEDFRKKAKELLEVFSKTFEYSMDNVAKFFEVKFSHLRVESGKIRTFEDQPSFGTNVIYINKR